MLTFIARGDVAFSVAMTAAATLVSLLLTPPLTWLLGGVWVPVDMGGLFWSIVKIVLVPVLLGLLLHHFQRGLVDRLMPFLPLASALVITPGHRRHHRRQCAEHPFGRARHLRGGHRP